MPKLKQNISLAEQVIREHLDKKIIQAAEIFKQSCITKLENEVGHKTKLSDTIDYRIKGTTIQLYSDNEIAMFLEKGTKPHIIKPKNGKALRFKSLEVYERKDGSKTSAGEYMYSTEVHHPGFPARAWMSQGIFVAKPRVKELFK